mgnify:CR=1 FL=1
MITITDLSVKKADGTTSVTYTALKGNTGDKTQALWRSETSSTLVSGRATVTLTPRASANGKARITDVVVSYPETYVNTTTGLTMVKDTDYFRGSFVCSQEVADATNNEFTAQTINLLTALLPAIRQGWGVN